MCVNKLELHICKKQCNKVIKENLKSLKEYIYLLEILKYFNILNALINLVKVLGKGLDFCFDCLLLACGSCCSALIVAE